MNVTVHTTHVREIRYEPVRKREPSYMTPWLVRLTLDGRWRRVRCAGGAVRQALYVHVGSRVYHMRDPHRTRPHRGHAFVWSSPD
jgi:hypothetical protein